MKTIGLITLLLTWSLDPAGKAKPEVVGIYRKQIKTGVIFKTIVCREILTGTWRKDNDQLRLKPDKTVSGLPAQSYRIDKGGLYLCAEAGDGDKRPLKRIR